MLIIKGLSKMNKLIFFLLLSIVNAFSSPIYIRVGATNSIQDLRTAKSILQKKEMNTLYKDEAEKHIIFSGPYSSEFAAFKDIQKIKDYFPYARTVLLESEENENSKNRSSEKTNSSWEWKLPSSNYTTQGFFLGVKGGSFSSSAVANDVNATYTLPKNKYSSYSIDLGYAFSNGVYTYFEINKAENSQISMNNYKINVDYQYPVYKNVNTHIGAVIGTSELTWKEFPIEDTNTSSAATSTNLLYGVHIGLNYNITDSWQVFGTYEYLLLNHSLEVDGANQTIDHSSATSIFVGIRYFFSSFL